jgi:plastocyanin
MRIIARLAWLLVLLIAAACGGDDSSGPGPGPAPGPDPEPGDVAVRDNFYQPAEVAVTLTDGAVEVVWEWGGNNQHNVTFDAGPPNSATQTFGSFSRTFSEAGRFTYFCTVHGRDVMSGAVEVQ